MKPRTVIRLLPIVILSLGCGCPHDVTTDPEFKFASVRNHLYATQIEMLVYVWHDSHTGEAHVEISPAGATNRGDLPTAIMPKGTFLRPVELIAETCEIGSMTIYVRIESGPYAGNKAKVWSDNLFLSPGHYSLNTGHPPVQHWQPDPRYLEAR